MQQQSPVDLALSMPVPPWPTGVQNASLNSNNQQQQQQQQQSAVVPQQTPDNFYEANMATVVTDGGAYQRGSKLPRTSAPPAVIIQANHLPPSDDIQQVTKLDSDGDDGDVEEVSQQGAFAKFCASPRGAIFRRVVFLILYLAYFFWSTLRCIIGDPPQCPQDEGWWTLLTLSNVAFGIILLVMFFNYLWPPIWRVLKRVLQPIAQWRFTKVIVYAAIIGGYLAFVIIDATVTREDPNSLISLGGVGTILLLCAAGSYSHRHINLRPVIVGLGLQFVFALVVLRWDLGQFIFEWLGQEVEYFLSNADAGAKFVWFSAWSSHDFAFTVLPIIPFFAAVTSVLYFLGWIQAIIKVLATIMEKLMGTTAGESTTCSANVFLGMTEAPLLIRPFLPHMTKSELHAVMTGGFATIAGSVMGAFIALGVDSRHLLAASLMAAPTALALSKLVYPETQKSAMKASDVAKYTEADKDSQPRNIIEAACEGASLSIPLVANIVANLIAIISLLSLIDSLLIWFGERAGLAPPLIDEPFTLEFIASYIFWPIAYLLGIPEKDCRPVGKLLGLKLFINEFVAFSTMAGYIETREIHDKYYCNYVYRPNNLLALPKPLDNGGWVLPAMNNTEIGPFMSQRAESVATYALCGFANMAAMGIQIGGIGALSPDKKPHLAAMAFRSMLTGTAVNLLNAATAGVLLPYQEPSWDAICAKYPV